MGHSTGPDGRGIGGLSLPTVEVAAPAPAVGLGPELPLKLHEAPDAGAVDAHVRLDLGSQLADGGQGAAACARAGAWVACWVGGTGACCWWPFVPCWARPLRPWPRSPPPRRCRSACGSRSCAARRPPDSPGTPGAGGPAVLARSALDRGLSRPILVS